MPMEGVLVAISGASRGGYRLGAGSRSRLGVAGWRGAGGRRCAAQRSRRLRSGERALDLPQAFDLLDQHFLCQEERRFNIGDLLLLIG